MTTSPHLDSFEQAAERFRREIIAHCYRMTGSIQDAEDLTQETYLRAWRGFDRFEGRSSVRTWLHTIATTVCLTALERRRRRPLPSDLSAPSVAADAGALVRQDDVPWLQPAPSSILRPSRDQPDEIAAERDAVRLAFVAALQHLSARQRAVLILRDALGMSASEAAAVLGVNEDAIHSLLYRARVRLGALNLELDAFRPDDDAQVRAVAAHYASAFEQADLDRLATLLAADVALEMPPQATWLRGRDDVMTFLGSAVLASTRWRLSRTSANGTSAFLAYQLAEDGVGLHPHAVQLLEVGPDDTLTRIVSFNEPSLIATFERLARIPDASLS